MGLPRRRAEVWTSNEEQTRKRTGQEIWTAVAGPAKRVATPLFSRTSDAPKAAWRLFEQASRRIPNFPSFLCVALTRTLSINTRFSTASNRASGALDLIGESSYWGINRRCCRSSNGMTLDL